MDTETVRKAKPTLPVRRFNSRHQEEETFFCSKVRVELRHGQSGSHAGAPSAASLLRAFLKVNIQVAPGRSLGSSRGGEPSLQQRSPGDARVNAGAMSRRKQGNPQHLSQRERTGKCLDARGSSHCAPGWRGSRGGDGVTGGAKVGPSVRLLLSGLTD